MFDTIFTLFIISGEDVITKNEKKLKKTFWLCLSKKATPRGARESKENNECETEEKEICNKTNATNERTRKRETQKCFSFCFLSVDHPFQCFSFSRLALVVLFFTLSFVFFFCPLAFARHHWRCVLSRLIGQSELRREKLKKEKPVVALSCLTGR